MTKALTIWQTWHDRDSDAPSSDCFHCSRENALGHLADYGVAFKDMQRLNPNLWMYEKFGAAGVYLRRVKVRLSHAGIADALNGAPIRSKA